MAPKLTNPEPQTLRNRALFYLNYSQKQKQAVQDYLLGKAAMPKYRPKFDKHSLEVLGKLSPDDYFINTTDSVVDGDSANKLQELRLVRAYKHMHDTGETGPFQRAVHSIYGEPKKGLFWQLMFEAAGHPAAASRDAEVLAELNKLINWQTMPKSSKNINLISGTELFYSTKQQFQIFYKHELALLRRAVADKPAVHRYSHTEMIALLSLLIKYYGLDKKGWTVGIGDRVDRIAVNYKAKQILVAETSFRLSRHRAIGLVLHEVSVHALSRKSIARYAKGLGQRRIIEEGLGTFVEQLAFDRFYPVRALRYIALGLAIGLDGRPRNAKEVYEVIWRLRYLSGVARNKSYAQEYAAKEVARIFRGMPLKQKGIVITKDRAYVEGNQIIWELIHKKGPDAVFGKLIRNEI